MYLIMYYLMVSQTIDIKVMLLKINKVFS